MRSFLLFWVGFLLLLGGTTAASARPGEAEKPAPLPLTGELIRTGLQLLHETSTEGLLKKLPFLLLKGLPPVGVSFDLNWKAMQFRLEAQIGQLRDREAKETNELLKKQLKVMLERLEQEKRQTELMAAQLEVSKGILDHQVRVFRYRTEGGLRKEKYNVPADKLVVVVADFSSGNLEEGREVADEIAHHLAELKKQGIDMHVLAGEVRPGVIIRSPEMAEDVGRHLPPDASYAVIWGTMSPRTMGRYRPHLTCVQKLANESGASVTMTLDLESQTLPLRSDPEKYQRQCYERLIGITCAALPSCYAMYEVSRERTPNLTKFYSFVGENQPEVSRLRTQLQPFTLWTGAREKGKFSYLHRLDTKGDSYPALLHNSRDNSVMTLLRDDSGKPMVFQGKDHKYITYIDVTETTNRQYVQFLNEMKGNHGQGGTTWIIMPENKTDIVREEKTSLFMVKPDKVKYVDAPIVYVCWYGALAYCQWAGKDLPAVEEWQAAARPVGQGNYPWGVGMDDLESKCHSQPTATHPDNAPVGSFASDKSRIGCFDMAGNVAEWCADGSEREGTRSVCGGSFADRKPEFFEITSKRLVPAIEHHGWIGFRGVVRIPVE
jgi:hypothetical protein